jgi:hypothetical protein
LNRRLHGIGHGSTDIDHLANDRVLELPGGAIVPHNPVVQVGGIMGQDFIAILDDQSSVGMAEADDVVEVQRGLDADDPVSSSTFILLKNPFTPCIWGLHIVYYNTIDP